MKATGIIRRIDDLGRVVIPREIRRAVGIKDGDALELYTDEKGVYFEKYNGREEAMAHTFQPMFLALYKKGYAVGLYSNGFYMGGHQLSATPLSWLTSVPLGTWAGNEYTLVYRTSDIKEGGEEVAHMLNMMAASLKEAAREIYGED